MLQAAHYGAQAFDAAAKRVASDVPPEGREREVDGAEEAGKVAQVCSTRSSAFRVFHGRSTIYVASEGRSASH